MGNEQKEGNQRCNNISGTTDCIVLELQRISYQHNNYIHVLITVLQKMLFDPYKVSIGADKHPRNENLARFDEPVINEVAIFIAGNEGDRRDIVLPYRKNQLETLTQTQKSYDALQYSLISKEGEDGYPSSTSPINPRTALSANDKIVSIMDFYDYRLTIRARGVNHTRSDRSSEPLSISSISPLNFI